MIKSFLLLFFTKEGLALLGLSSLVRRQRHQPPVTPSLP
jgi:hypothetical protein